MAAKKRIALTLALGTMFATTAFARDPWNLGLWSSLNLGVRYSSRLEARGATFYDGFQLDPVIALFFFDDRLEFLGDSIGYRDFVFGRSLRLRSRFARLVDDPLFPRDEAKLGPSNSRPDTVEWIQSLEWFLPAYDESYRSEIDVSFAQDLQAHHGQYLEVKAKAKILDFVLPVGGAIRVEPNAVATLGWGSGAHNDFLYGSGPREGGFNHLAYGIHIAFPDTADRFYPIVKIERTSLLGVQRRGSLGGIRPDGTTVQFIATFGVFDGSK